MSQKDGSVKVVLTAIVVNFFVTLAKAIGWVFSLSPSMLAEAIHSFADTANQSLVYLGIRISKKGSTREFPSGYGQARYLWNLISASGIFFIGFGLTVYHGVSSLISPHHEGQFSYGLAIGILIFALIVEGYALLVAFKEVNAHRGSMSLLVFFRESDDPTSIGVLLEDAIAVIGVLLALAGMAISYYFHTHIPDAIASILIGLLLGFLAFVMAFTNGRLLINRSISLSDEEEIREFVRELAYVDKITSLKTEILAPDQVKLSLEIDFNSSPIVREINAGRKANVGNEMIEDTIQTIINKSVKSVGKAINEMEKQIRDHFPDIKYIDLELN
ncbi:MAG: cation diffusion facilitator family transporter [Candidatus Marinimicrobia bacterium]|jgi:zinc transporter 9|nr:cation diffusion facilitator family transporter [Candidatus Neomarinimicrobiota bacterium]